METMRIGIKKIKYPLIIDAILNITSQGITTPKDALL